MQAVIMAGGKGTRLLEITQDVIPKAMAPVAGIPLIERQVVCLRDNGITDIIIVIGHLGEVIKEHFKDGREIGVNISYFEEEKPLGTAGAIPFISNRLEDDFFLVFGDLIFNIDLQKMMEQHHSKKALATLFVHPNAHPFDSDLVKFDANGVVKGFDSKNNTRNYWYKNSVNAAFYIFNKKICGFIPKDEKVDLEKDILSVITKEREDIFVYRSPEYIKDAGTVERITSTERDINSGIVSGKNLKNKQKAIFLDRDGTINKKNGLVYKTEQFELEECAATAIRKINNSGYLAIVISNQPVVARGLCGCDGVDEIHNKMETLLGKEGAFLDDILYCPHHPDKGYPEENPDFKIKCDCRKPGIKLIEICRDKYNIDLSKSYFIGDTTIDIQTGKNAGMHTVLVKTGDAGEDGKFDVKPDTVSSDLQEAVELILGGNNE